MKFHQRFYLRFLGFFASAVLVGGIIASSMSGCAALTQHSAAVELIVSQAAMRYIEGAAPLARVDRARRVVAIAEKILPLVSSDKVTVEQLASIALAAIPSDLSPADRALALSVINIAAQELRNKVGEGVLAADAVVTVKGVITSIENAALVYTGGS